jgi:signal transduction histidine kinase
MKRLPFRPRLTVWSTIVAAVSILICGAGAIWFAYRNEVGELDNELHADADHFFSELQRHGGAKFDWRKIDKEMREWLPARVPAMFMEITDGQKTRWRSSNLPAPGFHGRAPGMGRAKVGAENLRLLVENRNGLTFAVGSSLEEANSLASGLALALLAALPLALAFAWFGGRRLAAVAVAPVEKMTHSMERVSAEHLDLRVPEPTTPDEIQRHARVLNATLDRLERSYQQALRFSGDASHELKTPLTVLRASIEAVLDSPTLAEGDRAAISSLLEQTRRLTEITSSLLLLARADAGRLTLDLAEHDIAALTEACAEDARIVAEQRGVEVKCELPPNAPGLIDPLRLAQITSNLLDNAVKYNHAGGEVRVKLLDAGASWQLSVTNTGPGIPPEHQPRLFERFYRVEHSALEPGSGLGLGLARELARAHGGDVLLVRSRDGMTEFTATLPKNGRRNGS